MYFNNETVDTAVVDFEGDSLVVSDAHSKHIQLNQKDIGAAVPSPASADTLGNDETHGARDMAVPQCANVQHKQQSLGVADMVGAVPGHFQLGANSRGGHDKGAESGAHFEYNGSAVDVADTRSRRRGQRLLNGRGRRIKSRRRKVQARRKATAKTCDILNVTMASAGRHAQQKRCFQAQRSTSKSQSDRRHAQQKRRFWSLDEFIQSLHSDSQLSTAQFHLHLLEWSTYCSFTKQVEIIH